jgi:hypothetical protein
MQGNHVFWTYQVQSADRMSAVLVYTFRTLYYLLQADTSYQGITASFRIPSIYFIEP